MEYLTDIEVRTLLTVEMFLGKERKTTLSIWIDVSLTSSNYQLNIHSVFDNGDHDHVDLYDFSPVNPDEMFRTIQFETLDGLLTHFKASISSINFDLLIKG